MMGEEGTPATEGQAPAEPQAPESPMQRAERLNKSTLESEKRIDEKMAKFEDSQANALMEGTAVSAPEGTQKKETNKEYRARINQELSEGKFNGKSG